MVERLADLAERYDRGVAVTADHMGVPESHVVAVVDHIVAVRRGGTPERRAAREAHYGPR